MNKTAHVEIIRAELAKRQAHNPRYSLRGFADFLEMHPSALSRILNGKQGLSIKSAQALLQKIPLTEEERHAFVKSIAREKYEEVCSELNHVASVAERTPYQDLVEFLPTPCWMLSHEGEVIERNKGCVSYFADVAAFKRTEDLIHTEDQALYSAKWKSARENQMVFQVECRVRGPNGSYSLRQIRTMPFRDEWGTIIGWLAMTLEVAQEASGSGRSVEA